MMQQVGGVTPNGGYYSGHATPQALPYGGGGQYGGGGGQYGGGGGGQQQQYAEAQYAAQQQQYAAQNQYAAAAAMQQVAYSGHATPMGAYSGHATPQYAASGHVSGHATPQYAASGYVTPHAGGGQVPYQADIPEDLGTWEERVHPENGHKFFYNTTTGVSQYELPTWVDSTDPASGRVYYFNTATRVSTYDRPSDFVPIKRLPRAQVADGGAIEDPYAANGMHVPQSRTPTAAVMHSGGASVRASRPQSGHTTGYPSHLSRPGSQGPAQEVYRGASTLQPKALGSGGGGGDSEAIE